MRHQEPEFHWVPKPAVWSQLEDCGFRPCGFRSQSEMCGFSWVCDLLPRPTGRGRGGVKGWEDSIIPRAYHSQKPSAPPWSGYTWARLLGKCLLSAFCRLVGTGVARGTSTRDLAWLEQGKREGSWSLRSQRNQASPTHRVCPLGGGTGSGGYFRLCWHRALFGSQARGCRKVASPVVWLE